MPTVLPVSSVPRLASRIHSSFASGACCLFYAAGSAACPVHVRPLHCGFLRLLTHCIPLLRRIIHQSIPCRLPSRRSISGERFCRAGPVNTQPVVTTSACCIPISFKFFITDLRTVQHFILFLFQFIDEVLVRGGVMITSFFARILLKLFILPVKLNTHDG